MEIKQTCKNTLVRLSDFFSYTAIECFDVFFGKQGELHMPWEVVDHLQGKFDFILTVGGSNSRYSALMYAGIQHEALEVFTGIAKIDSEMAADILGEFVNTYSGMIADHQEFTDEFGFLTQAVPVMYSDGQTYLPFIWGIQGYVYCGAHWIYVGYSIRENAGDNDSM